MLVGSCKSNAAAATRLSSSSGNLQGSKGLHTLQEHRT